jgi:hypothetical protein
MIRYGLSLILIDLPIGVSFGKSFFSTFLPTTVTLRASSTSSGEMFRPYPIVKELAMRKFSFVPISVSPWSFVRPYDAGLPPSKTLKQIAFACPSISRLNSFACASEMLRRLAYLVSFPPELMTGYFAN